MKMRYITAAFLGILLLNSPAQVTANAVDNSSYEQYERSIGLIEKCSLRCTSPSNGILEITAKTQVSGKIREVGVKNVVIQYSSDGSSWSDELSLGDITKSNARYLSLDGRRVDVKGGGFYRVSVVHYADGNGSSDRIQTAIQVSPSVWVNEKPKPTTTSTTTTTTTTSTTTKKITTTKVTTTAKTTTKHGGTTAKTTAAGNGSVTTTKAGRSSVNGASGGTSVNRSDSSARTTSSKSETTTASTTAAKQSSSPKTGDSLPVMEFTALCSAGAVALFLHSKRPKRS
ncbi:hypothetical protein [uncultured Ruminococcus sp.]|uniref:hypothetical protein n=1 Tax=uncultured Ruminococcus sp. TaxID=165186 RepID=UPI0026256D3F|nr:hypothetical protein [uncultured Ruminococcus sp.]